LILVGRAAKNRHVVVLLRAARLVGFFLEGSNLRNER